MPDRYPHFLGGSQICGQSAPPVKGTNGKKLKMLNCKFACISDPAANTMQTAVSRLARISSDPRGAGSGELEKKVKNVQVIDKDFTISLDKQAIGKILFFC